MIQRGAFAESSSFMKICVLLLVILVYGIIAFLISAIFNLIFKFSDFTDTLRITLFIQNTCIFVLSPFTVSYLLWDTSIKNALRLGVPNPYLAIMGCLLIIVSSPLVDALNTWNQSLNLPEFLHSVEQWMVDKEKQAEVLTSQMLNINSWGGLLMNLLVIALLAGIGEELLFRGVLQKIMIGWTKNIHWGVWITAIIFSAIHLQFFGFIPRLALGALLGYLFVWSKNLWVPILAHTINNAFVVIFTPNDLNKGNEVVEFTETAGNSPLLVATSIVLVCLFLYAIKRVGQKEKPITNELNE